MKSGSIRWDGASLLGLTAHEIAARGIAIVPQGRRLFPSLTVTEHLTMLKSARVSKGWTVARMFDLFPRLAERRHHRGGQLSGGERQMLAVARALMIDPELILMDEPSEGLAPVMVQHLEQIVLDLKREKLSILLVEQNLYSALATADRVYVMETGAIVHEAPAAALTRKSRINCCVTWGFNEQRNRSCVADVRIAGNEPRVVDIGIREGRIVAIEQNLVCDAPAQNLLTGGSSCPDFAVETHIHLDKSCIIDRCTIRHGTPGRKPLPSTTVTAKRRLHRG